VALGGGLFLSRRLTIVLKMMLSFAGSLLALVLCAGNLIYAQEAVAKSKDQPLAQMPLKDVRIEAQTIRGLFSDLSLSYRIPVGVEMAFDDNDLSTYRLELKKGTLSELLTKFFTQHDQYAWEIKDGVVRIYPTGNHRDAVVDELLETQIGSLFVEEGSGCSSLEDAIANAAEVKRILKANGVTYRRLNFTGFYIPQLGERFRLDVSNITVRAILNKVIKESPLAKMWVIKRYGTDQTLYINISANSYETPRKYGDPAELINQSEGTDPESGRNADANTSRGQP
jgi:hypothetical protein